MEQASRRSPYSFQAHVFASPKFTLLTAWTLVVHTFHNIAPIPSLVMAAE
jgi:hypothetical protein